MNNDVNTTKELTQDSKNMAILSWIGTLFFGFIPGLVLYLVKKDDPYVADQSKESLNWSITAILAYLAAMLLSFIVIGVFLMPIIGICHLIFALWVLLQHQKAITSAFHSPFA